MREKLSSAFGFVAAIAALVLGGWVVVRGVLDQPSIVSAIVTSAGAVGAVAFQRDRENKREVAALHREKLAPKYETLFVRFRDGVDFTEPEDLEFMQELQQALLFYGSSPVVRAWVRWLRQIDVAAEAEDDDGEGELTDPTVLLEFERVLLAIRADLGLANTGLEPGDLLRVYVTDADAVVKPWLAAGNRLPT